MQTSSQVVERCLLMTTDPGDLVLDPTCVRKGTGVWCSPSPALPIHGEGAPCSPRVRGDERGAGPRVRGDERGARLVPIETIQPGDWVLAHDGDLHRVLRVTTRHYRERMIGIRHQLSDKTLWLTADHRMLARTRPRSLGGRIGLAFPGRCMVVAESCAVA